jgi:hypothetical protein
MRIAQINLPITGNNGESLNVVHFEIKRDLCEHFGGYTVTEGQGGWINGDGELIAEPVAVYQVAYDESKRAAPGIIASIACAAGKTAGQDAMFFVIDGEAEIVTID